MTIPLAAFPCHWGPLGVRSSGGEMGWATPIDLGGWPLVEGSFVRLWWTIPTSPSIESRLGLPRSQHVTRKELVDMATIRDHIFSCTKAPARTPLRMSSQNWCHFTVPARPHKRPPIQQGDQSG